MWYRAPAGTERKVASYHKQEILWENSTAPCPRGGLPTGEETVHYSANATATIQEIAHANATASVLHMKMSKHIQQ
ncbi:hypothetical protein M0804_014092 [Polistes exclamans]|nr:hypothetical protein M0804_014092 [Polistes exclamans]